MLCAISNICAVPIQGGSIASRRNVHFNREQVFTIVTEAINLVLDAEVPRGGNDQYSFSIPPPNPPNSPANPLLTFSYPSTNDERNTYQEANMSHTRKRRRTSSIRSSASGKDGYEGDNECSDPSLEEEDLLLRLGIVSEVKKSKELISDWSYIGAELRHIANSFEKSCVMSHGGTGATNCDFEVFGFLKTFLPSSLIPSSLWSAICSYALWRIIKKL